VQVKVAVPQGGFGQAIHEPLIWLQNNLGSGNYAQHGAPTLGGSAVAFYFRDVVAAQAFMKALPDLILADRAESIACSSSDRNTMWSTEHFLGVCNLYSLTEGPSGHHRPYQGLG